jgi:hypothetical protein
LWLRRLVPIHYLSVIPVRVTGIHANTGAEQEKTWVAGTGPAMTRTRKTRPDGKHPSGTEYYKRGTVGLLLLDPRLDRTMQGPAGGERVQGADATALSPLGAEQNRPRVIERTDYDRAG